MQVHAQCKRSLVEPTIKHTEAWVHLSVEVNKHGGIRKNVESQRTLREIKSESAAKHKTIRQISVKSKNWDISKTVLLKTSAESVSFLFIQHYP